MFELRKPPAGFIRLTLKESSSLACVVGAGISATLFLPPCLLVNVQRHCCSTLLSLLLNVRSMKCTHPSCCHGHFEAFLRFATIAEIWDTDFDHRIDIGNWQSEYSNSIFEASCLKISSFPEDHIVQSILLPANLRISSRDFSAASWRQP